MDYLGDHFTLFHQILCLRCCLRPKANCKAHQDEFGTPRIIFQLTTKGNIPIVQETINRIHSVCQQIKYSKYETWVVTDMPEEFQQCRTITVPEAYSCNAAFKGRALQYAVEVRKQEKKNTEDIYIFHLDDESLITKQTMYSVLTFLEENPSPISEGLIIYPLDEKEKIKITNLLDTLRPFCCFECVDFMTQRKPRIHTRIKPSHEKRCRRESWVGQRKNNC